MPAKARLSGSGKAGAAVATCVVLTEIIARTISRLAAAVLLSQQAEPISSIDVLIDRQEFPARILIGFPLAGTSRQTGPALTGRPFSVLGPMSKVACYIDGFNLYHSIDELRKPHLKWVNLWALAESFVRP